MKKILIAFSLLLGTTVGFAQFTPTTVTAIQQVSDSALHVADSLGIGNTSKWLLQTSPLNGQKVEITALVVVPPHIITYTGLGNNMIVCDTGAAMNQPWSHIFVRYGSDNASFDANGYNSIQAGDIIVLKGTISEFPLSSMNSLTQFAPAVTEPVNIISSGNPLPTIPLMSITDFNTGTNPGGKVNIFTGEKYESKEVMFTNLTVTAIVNPSRGTWAVTDANGNTLSMYDYSYHFTLDTTATDRINSPHDLSYKVPPIGAHIDTLRGFISTSSGAEASRGYRFSPIYPEDVKYGFTSPGLTTHRRYPVIPTLDSTVTIQAKAFQQFGGDPVSSVKLVYKVGAGSWNEIAMTAAQVSVDSLYSGTIPKQSAGTYVYYFVKVTDTSAHSTILTNSGSLTQYDSTQGLFFYKVLDRTAQPVLSIRDVQYTPFLNGRTPFLGAVDSVGGIVTADTSALTSVPPTYGGTSAWYMQSTNLPWSGIHIGGADSVMIKLHIGDSVIVTGTLTEFNDVTEVFPVTSVRVVSTGNQTPAPVVLKTEVLGSGVASGDPGAEPYEGMLVRFNDVTVTNINPTFVDPTEYEVSNSSKSILVRRDGKNTYSNVQTDSLLGYTLFHTDDVIQSITGVVYYANNRYKLVPRTNADFDYITSVRRVEGNVLPNDFALQQNFPNPFNPTTSIQYSLPVNGLVNLKVYNVIGQEVMTLVNTAQKAGVYSATFDASKLSSGVYLYRLSVGNFSQVKKMMLLK